MGFFMSAVAAATTISATVSAMSIPVQHVKRDACSTGNWVEPDIVGGSDAPAFCETKWGSSYLPITGLSVWTDNVRIRGIQATYSDSTQSQVWGQIDSTSTANITVDYSKGDRFTTVTSYGNGVGTESGHLYMEASNKQSMDIGKSTKGITPYPQNVGAGILLGLVGNAGSDINSVGFLFLESEIDHIEVGSMTFPNPPTGQDQMAPVILSQQHYYNNQSTGNVSWTFTGQQQQSATTTYSQSVTTTFGVSEALEISGEAFGIGGKTTDTLSWSLAATEETQWANTNGIALTWGENGSLAPGKGVDCTAVVQKGQGNFQYDAKVTIHLKNQNSYTYSESGTLNNVAFSQAYVTTQDDDTNNTPNGISSGSTS